MVGGCLMFLPHVPEVSLLYLSYGIVVVYENQAVTLSHCTINMILNCH